MKQSWLHLAALGVFVLVGLAWGLVRCGVLGEMPTRIPRNSAELDVLPPEELPPEGIPGYPRRYFDGTGTVRGLLAEPTQGSPYAGATVLVGGRPDLSTTSAADGSFELSGVPAGLDIALRVETEDGSIHGVSAIGLRPDATVELGTLLIGAPRTWAGRVTGPDGAGLPGAVVTIHERHLLEVRAEHPAELPLHRRPPAMHRAVTDKQGRYAIPGVVRTDLTVVVRAAGYVPLLGGVSGWGGPEVVHDCALERAVPIRGIVLDPAGRPVLGASVLLMSSLAGGEGLLTARYAVTDAKGRFRFTTVRRPDERLAVFAGTTLFTWDERLADGMQIRLR